MNSLRYSMRFLSFCFVMIASTAGLTGCYSTTGTVSHDPTAYISVIGAAPGDLITIDAGPPIEVSSDSALKPMFVTPGKHAIRVARAGTMILVRDVLVSDLQTLEVRVP
jgi:hypothetical protein